MITTNILVIDDQLGTLQALRDDFLRRVGADERWHFEFCSAQEDRRNSVRKANEAVARRFPRRGDQLAHDVAPWALVLLDVRFDQVPESRDDETFGFSCLAHLREVFGPDLPIVMLTSEDEDKRRRAGRFRADGYLSKEQLSRATLEDRLTVFGLVEDTRPEPKRLVGRSLAFLRVLRLAREVARGAGDGCIIYGESGSGKTLLGEYIHDHAGRKGPFHKWTAIPLDEGLMKDELFGHWKGAHSRAEMHSRGRIEDAHTGTFFLDEIANLTPGVQQLFLELRRRDHRGRRTLSRLGRSPETPYEIQKASETILGDFEDGLIKVDLFLLSATNVDLRDPNVRATRRFQDDLLKSLGTEIDFPNLNQRRSDIPLLFESFVRQRAGEKFAIDPAVFAQLQALDWTGRNVEVLRQMAVRAVEAARDFREILWHHVDPAVRGVSAKAPVPADTLTRAELRSTNDLPAGIRDLPALLDRIDVSSGSIDGILPELQEAYARLVLRLLGAALRATRDRNDKTSSLEAVCKLLGKPKLTNTTKGESAKAYDIIKRLVALADVEFSRRGASDPEVLSDDDLVIKHVAQALQRGAKPARKPDR